VLERETGLGEVAETGVMVHADVSADLLRTIFTPKSPLHDGAVIIRDDRIVAAGALLPLAEMSIHTERFGTRHRAALGITEQTDAVVVVVSEENGQISLVERARIVRNLTESGLARAIQTLLYPAAGRRAALGWRAGAGERTLGGRSPRIRELGRFVGRPESRRPAAATATGPQATPASAPPAPAAPGSPAAPTTVASDGPHASDGSSPVGSASSGPHAASQPAPPASAPAAAATPPPAAAGAADDAIAAAGARAPR
jgi:hypothetical protein